MSTLIRRTAIAVLAAALFAAPAAADVEVGEEAPDFTLTDEQGNAVTLSSFRGKRNVLLAFFPQAFTGGCTREFKSLGKAHPDIEAANIEILGISADAPEKLARFVAALGLQFRLLSDPDLETARTWGVYVATPKGGFASRSVFLLDKEGKVFWLDRDFPPPASLEGTELIKKIVELGGAAADPTEALKDLPSPEREGKTLLARLLMAICTEDIRGVDACIHPAFGTRMGETQKQQEDRRRDEIQRYRDLFRDHEIRGMFTFEGLVDLSIAKVHDGQAARDAGSGALTADNKKLSDLMADGDILVFAPTKAPEVTRTDEEGKETSTLVVPKEIFLLARKHGDAWKAVATAKR